MDSRPNLAVETLLRSVTALESKLVEILKVFYGLGIVAMLLNNTTP